MNTWEPSPSQELLQRRVTGSAFVMGAGVAIWVLPIAAVFNGVPSELFNLGVGLATAFSVGSFLAGAFWASQRRALQRWENFAAAHELEDKALRGEVAEMRSLVNAMTELVCQRIEKVSTQVMQENFNAWGNGYAVGTGEEQIVEEGSTRALPDARVYRMPQHQARVSQYDVLHERVNRGPTGVS